MTATMSPVRVRIHITDGQRLALITVLDNTPEPRVRVSSHTVLFDLDDPRSWLEARMAEWPRGEFPRASLHGVLRSLRSAIQGQAQPDLIPTVASRLEPCEYCPCCPDGCAGADCPCTALDGEEAGS